MISAWNLKKTNAPLNSIDDKVSTELILLGVWKDGVTNMVCLRERSELRREFNSMRTRAVHVYRVKNVQ